MLNSPLLPGLCLHIWISQDCTLSAVSLKYGSSPGMAITSYPQPLFIHLMGRFSPFFMTSVSTEDQWRRSLAQLVGVGRVVQDPWAMPEPSVLGCFQVGLQWRCSEDNGLQSYRIIKDDKTITQWNCPWSSENKKLTTTMTISPVSLCHSNNSSSLFSSHTAATRSGNICFSPSSSSTWQAQLLPSH